MFSQKKKKDKEERCSCYIKNMKILLLRPNHTVHGNHAEVQEDEFKYRRTGESLALGYLEAVLAEENEVEIIDGVLQNMSNEDIVNYIEQNNFDLIGFSTNVYIELENNLKIIKACNTLEKAFVVMGGHVASFVDKELIKADKKINCIIRYEGEEPFVELVKAISKAESWKRIGSLTYIENDIVIQNSPKKHVNKDLNKLPFPKRDMIGKVKTRDALINICTSRGCYGACSFCSVSAFYKHKEFKWSGRNPEDMVSEIELLINKYGCRHFLFVDDNYVGPGRKGIERIERVADLLIEKKMQIKYATNFRANDVIRAKDILDKLQKSGLSYVFLGTESGSQKQLDFFGKRISVSQNEEAVRLLDENRIGITQGVILFDYRMSVQELQENLDYLLRTKGVNAGKFNSKLLIYHGTELYDQYKEQHPELDDDYADAIEPPFENEEIDKIFRNVDETLVWGAEWYNDLEDIYWDCVFKYDMYFPKELEDLNYKINETIVSYIKIVIEKVRLKECCKSVNEKMLQYIINKYGEIQKFKKEFENKYNNSIY